MASSPSNGRVVFISGATGSLGRAAAAAFATDGDRVALCGRDGARLAAIASELRLPNDRWAPVVADLVDADQAANASRQATDAFGRIDILLHLVGGFASGVPIVDLDRAATQSMLDQHIWTTLNLVQAVVPGMVERGWGRVVAVATTAAVTAPAKSGPYAAAKAAQEVLLRSLAKEVSASGVTVNVIALRAIDERHERETAPSPKNAASTTPEEAVAVIRFLCSDAAAAINGGRIALDGRS